MDAAATSRMGWNMAMRGRACALLLVSCLMAAASASFVNPYSEEKHVAVKSDVKYIKCQVCNLVVKHSRKAVKQAREDQGHKFEEAVILDLLEKMCDPDAPEGLWVTQHDMVEKGDKIEVVDTNQAGECNTECRTLARACNEVMEEADLTELSEALYHNTQSRSDMEKLLCRELTPACSKKPPPVPKTRKPGPAHAPITADKLQMKQMMQRMKASGLGGQMYNTEDLLKQMKDMPSQEGGLTDDELLSAYEKNKAQRQRHAATAGGGTLQGLLGQGQQVLQESVRQGAQLFKQGVGKAAALLESWRARAADAVGGLAGKGAGEASGVKSEL